MNTQMIKNEYIGDGIYANQGRFPGEIILTSGHHLEDPHADPENHEYIQHCIYLDPEVGKNLYRYLKNIFEN